MELFYDKDDDKAWKYADRLSDINILKEVRDIWEQYALYQNVEPKDNAIMQEFFRRYGMKYYIPNAYSLKFNLEFGTDESNLIEVPSKFIDKRLFDFSYAKEADKLN
jgi:Na+-transporting NADH:ubiquinone oxidoreductase subunit NqrF